MQNNHPIFGSGSIYLIYSSVTKYHIKHVHKYHSNSMMKWFSNPSVRDSILSTWIILYVCVSDFLLNHKASGRKRMWPLHLFVLMHLRKQKNGRPGHSIWHKTPWLQQHLGGGLQLLLGRIEVGFLELRYGPYLHSVQYVKA